MDEEVQPVRLSVAVFEAILTAFQPPLQQFVDCVLNDSTRAGEITRDVFVDAYRLTQLAGAPFVPEGDPEYVRLWLFKAAYNKTVSELHRRARIPVLPYGGTDASETIRSDDLYAGDQPLQVGDIDIQCLRSTLTDVPRRNFICYVLNVVYGFTALESAYIVGIQQGTAAKRIRRAKDTLLHAVVTMIPGRP